MRLRGGGLFIAMIAALLGAALMPAAAGAATVANGGFETGTLSGWNQAHELGAGEWFAYRGTEAPYGGKRGSATPVQAPPQGRFAAITDEVSSDTLTLWHDVHLEPAASHTLSLQAFYQSELPLGLPSPDVLSAQEEAIGEQANIQFRIDVMKPSAALNSIAPEDILATLFQTTSSSPQRMAPTRFSADLSPFAGQTVRIRAVVVDRPDPNRVQAGGATEGVFNAGIDNVVITSAGPGIPGSGSKGGAGDRISFGHPRPNRKNGTVVLPVKVPAAGLIAAMPAGKKKPKPILTAKKRVAGATTANLTIKPTAAGRKILERKHKLRVKVSVAFNPDRGASETKTVSVLLRLAAPKHR